MRYLITVRIEAIHDDSEFENKLRTSSSYGKSDPPKDNKTVEMVNVRMLATNLERAKENAKAAVDLMGE